MNFTTHEAVQVIHFIRIHHRPGRMAEDRLTAGNVDFINDRLRCGKAVVVKRSDFPVHADTDDVIDRRSAPVTGIPLYAGKEQQVIRRKRFFVLGIIPFRSGRGISVISQSKEVIPVLLVNPDGGIGIPMAVRACCMHV